MYKSMKDHVLIEGKEYISSGRAAEITKYSQDYIGQLARHGTIDARLVGRSWFVEKNSIIRHLEQYQKSSLSATIVESPESKVESKDGEKREIENISKDSVSVIPANCSEAEAQVIQQMIQQNHAWPIEHKSGQATILLNRSKTRNLLIRSKTRNLLIRLLGRNDKKSADDILKKTYTRSRQALKSFFTINDIGAVKKVGAAIAVVAIIIGVGAAVTYAESHASDLAVDVGYGYTLTDDLGQNIGQKAVVAIVAAKTAIAYGVTLPPEQILGDVGSWMADKGLAGIAFIKEEPTRAQRDGIFAGQVAQAFGDNTIAFGQSANAWTLALGKGIESGSSYAVRSLAYSVGSLAVGTINGIRDLVSTSINSAHSFALGISSTLSNTSSAIAVNSTASVSDSLTSAADSIYSVGGIIKGWIGGAICYFISCPNGGLASATSTSSTPHTLNPTPPSSSTSTTHTIRHGEWH
jgi:hypothetical protein